MNEIITSGKNPRLKEISALLKQKKERDEKGFFVIEGVRIVKDAIAYAGHLVRTVFVSETFDTEQLKLKTETDPEAPGITADKESNVTGGNGGRNCSFELVTVKTSVFEEISGTVSSQGVLAVVEKPSYELKDLLGGGRYLLLEDIQDPGNLGTMIRTAEAAGISAVIMSRNTADMFNPKVTRSTMGSCFRVPFIYAENFSEAVNCLKANGIRVYGAYLRGGRNYREVEFAGNCGIMIGNEGNGLTDEAIALADERVFIPMEGKIESLNAAVAAAILMYR